MNACVRTVIETQANAERAVRPRLKRVPAWEVDRDARVDRLLGEPLLWFVVLVPPQRELVVERILTMCGWRVLLPLVYRYRRVNSRQRLKKRMAYVVASRYVFLGVPKGEPFPWARLLKLDLTNGVLSFEGAPVGLSQEVMLQLWARMRQADAKPIPSAVRLNRGLEAGDMAVITNGPFRTFEAQLESIDRGRSQVEVNLFGQKLKVEVSLSDLEAV